MDIFLVEGGDTRQWCDGCESACVGATKAL